MKISLNTIRSMNLRYGSADDIAKIGVDKLIDKIGAQLGAVEEVVQFGEKYHDVVIVRVVGCVPHPNADKLKVCTIDDSGTTEGIERDKDGLIQVVCGAPNVREGLMAAWLPPGSTVPDTVDKDPFVLEARELRGVVSNGMLASPKELALSDSHDGILEIEGRHRAGTSFAKSYGLEYDVVVDIENKMFTHRPDCFGFLGIARELAGIQGMPFKSPAWYTIEPQFPEIEAEELKLEIRNEIPELVPRFTAVTVRDVAVGPSPVWLQVELAKAGQKSINNVVDWTNFFMLETGQPLHAYDYDKVKALNIGEAQLIIRKPRSGEKLKLLNGKEIEPRAEAVVIATDEQLIGLGGVMGGVDTEVDEHTKNIIIECANFDMYSIRRTSMEHGLFTDAVTRFTKGQSPLQNPAVQARIIQDIRNFAGGKVASRLIDDNHVSKAVFERGSVHPPVAVSTSFINLRLGLELSARDMKKLLQNVEFEVTAKDDELLITAPFWRTDIEIPEDIVEEIGRLYGYGELPLKLPQRDLSPAVRDPLLDAKAEIRARLSRAGANEILTYSFIPGSLLDKVGQDHAKAFEIANALSPDLQYYRISLMPSLLEKVHPNVKSGHDEFALFEIGKGHSLDDMQDDGLPAEFEFTALVVTANDKLRRPGAAYYQAKTYLEALAGTELIYKPVTKEMQKYPVVKPYEPGRSALVSVKGGDFLGIIGEFRPSVSRALKLPRFTSGFEIDTTVLQRQMRSGMGYVPLFKFPGVKQDITLKVAADVQYDELYDFLDKTFGLQAPEGTYIQLEPVDIYQKAEDTKHRQITFRVTITDPKRTLTDKEVTGVLDAVAASVKTKLKADRI